MQTGVSALLSIPGLFFMGWVGMGRWFLSRAAIDSERAWIELDLSGGFPSFAVRVFTSKLSFPCGWLVWGG